MAKLDEADMLRGVLDAHIRRIDELTRKQHVRDEERARLDAEDERKLAWLESKQCWTLDYDEGRKEFIIPHGWPPGHVRKPKQEAPPADEPKADLSPDTMMHRMLKDAQSSRR